MQRFDALGASANAFTSFDKTAYYFSCTENFSKALEVLLDFVATPYFTGPSVRRERGIIAEELRMYRDSPEWMVTANLLQAMYHVHPIREDIAGTEESIAHIDAALLCRCYKRFYCPGNMVLSVAGCFEEDAVLELAEKYFPTAKTAANPLTIREPRTVREHYCEQKMPIAMPMFQVGFKAAGGEKENMRHRLLDELLLDLICGETTDLYRRLYEAGEINATFGSEVMAGRDFICAMFDGESRQPQAVYEALCERVTTLQRQGIPPQDFARCRRANYGRTIGLYGRAESIAGLMAAELGVDVAMAKRAGLLHDLGKSIDHEVEGSHVQLGADLARKFKENPVIVNAIEAHHGDVEPKTVIAVLVQAADAISAARPGARRENVENYIRRLQKLEELTGSYPGVEKAYAIQAGREVRIMVKPEEVSEDNMILLARDVAKKIEAELEYPGQIKVNVIRETKAVEYAK